MDKVSGKLINLCAQLSDKMTKQQYDDFILCIKTVRWMMKTITIEVETTIDVKNETETQPLKTDKPKKENDHE
jgi:hypothetical protein